jgi:hypothetical protein
VALMPAMRSRLQLAFALLACAAALAASPASSGCAEGCAAHGTCHAPLRRCDCPRYYAGADCSVRATPSCLVDAASGLDSGCRRVSSCACMLECEAAGFRPLDINQCFNYSSPQPSVDAMPASPLLEFGTLEDVYPGVENSGVSFLKAPWAAVSPTNDDSRYVPVAACPDSCSGAGYCKRHAGNGATHCACMDDRRGDLGKCETPDPEKHCLGACSGRGECKSGFCHCQAGAYGADCSLTGQDREELYWRSGVGAGGDAELRPRIYVYTLPPRFNTWHGVHAPQRNLGVMLHERLLTSRYRTADPEQADFFYVPTSPMGPVNHYVSVRAAEWVASQYPYWARKRGADHLYAFNWDFGACWLGGHPAMNASILISHFGLNQRLKEYACACPACAPYTAGKDLVVPDTMEAGIKKAMVALAASGPPERTTFLFFSGGRTGPARNALFDAKLNGTGVRVLEGGDIDLATEMSSSVFCISAPGSGFGTRFVAAITAGCIPISFVDAVREPFEDVVDLDAISIRVPQARLADMVSILRNVSDDDIAAKQAELACVRPHFLWSSALGALGDEDGGADAFEILMYALRRRITPGPHPLLSCATKGVVPGAPQPLRTPCPLQGSTCFVTGRRWPPGGAACGPQNERPC